LEGAALRTLKTLRFGADAPDEKVVEAARHGAGLKLRIERVTSPEVAKTLQGKSVWVDRQILPAAEPGSFYHFDLIGLAVFSDDAPVGTLTRIESVPGGVDRWWVKTTSGDVAVPASRRFLKTVNPAAGRLDVLEWANLLALDQGLD